MTPATVRVPGRPVLAIDPGSSRSAWVLLEGDAIRSHGILPNEELLDWLRTTHATSVIEDVEPRQQPLGREVADTLRWVGRFHEALSHCPVHLVTRRAVTAHHVDGGTKDADRRIRAALIDRYGPGSERKGGPLAGIVKDMWSALAIGLWFVDTHPEGDV